MINAPFRLLRHRVDRLARRRQRAPGYTADKPWYAFRVAPTCPPTTSLHVWGGTCFNDKSYYWSDDDNRTFSHKAYTVPGQSYDLQNEDRVIVDVGWSWEVGVGYIATNYITKQWETAYTYIGGTLLLCLPEQEDDPGPGDWNLRLHCFPEEYATGGEAEMRLQTWWLESYNPGPFATSNTTAHYWPDPVYYTRSSVDYYIRQDTGMPLCGVILRNDGTLGPGRFFQPVDAVNRGRSYLWPRDARPRWIET